MPRTRIHALPSCFLITLACLSSLPLMGNNARRYDHAYRAYLDAGCPIAPDQMQHFVYFARERHELRGHPLLEHPRFAGAQIMYPWARLEPAEGEYDFSMIRDDVAYLESFGKKLFIQLQDTTFDPNNPGVPEYMTTEEYDGGQVIQRDDDGQPVGWAAKRWNPRVRERFARLLQALGEKFDGRIEGINLQETAIGVTSETDQTFSPAIYVESLKANMLAMKEAFPRSTTMLYANFMPGEWLPWDDAGYLRSIYLYGEEIGVGLGAPDLMVQRRAQLNHALAMMHEHRFTVPLGIAIQDGNYFGETGADFPPGTEGMPLREDRENLVPLLHAFAKDFLKVKYMFWVSQEPYFEEDVLTCFAAGE